MLTFSTPVVAIGLAAGPPADTITADIAVDETLQPIELAAAVEKKLKDTTVLLDEEMVHSHGHMPGSVEYVGGTPFKQAVVVGDAWNDRRTKIDGMPIDSGRCETTTSPLANFSVSLPTSSPCHCRVQSVSQAPSVHPEEPLPKALALHITLSDKVFLPDRHVIEHSLSVKIEVFFNGQVANAKIITPEDYFDNIKPFQQVFAGTRVGDIVERPWVIVPPSQDSNGSTRPASNSTSVEVRWMEICTGLMEHASMRPPTIKGEPAPSTHYLKALASMPMPYRVMDMQRLGRKFGVVDVVVTTGVGNTLGNLVDNAILYPQKENVTAFPVDIDGKGKRIVRNDTGKVPDVRDNSGSLPKAQKGPQDVHTSLFRETCASPPPYQDLLTGSWIQSNNHTQACSPPLSFPPTKLNQDTDYLASNIVQPYQDKRERSEPFCKEAAATALGDLSGRQKQPTVQSRPFIPREPTGNENDSQSSLHDSFPHTPRGYENIDPILLSLSGGLDSVGTIPSSQTDIGQIPHHVAPFMHPQNRPPQGPLPPAYFFGTIQNKDSSRSTIVPLRPCSPTHMHNLVAQKGADYAGSVPRRRDLTGPPLTPSSSSSAPEPIDDTQSDLLGVHGARNMSLWTRKLANQPYGLVSGNSTNEESPITENPVSKGMHTLEPQSQPFDAVLDHVQTATPRININTSAPKRIRTSSGKAEISMPKKSAALFPDISQDLSRKKKSQTRTLGIQGPKATTFVFDDPEQLHHSRKRQVKKMHEMEQQVIEKEKVAINTTSASSPCFSSLVSVLTSTSNMSGTSSFLNTIAIPNDFDNQDSTLNTNTKPQTLPTPFPKSKLPHKPTTKAAYQPATVTTTTTTTTTPIPTPTPKPHQSTRNQNHHHSNHTPNLCTENNPTPNKNSSIQYATSERGEGSSALRQVRAERMPFFEEGVVVGFRFFVEG